MLDFVHSSSSEGQACSTPTACCMGECFTQPNRAALRMLMLMVAP